MAPNEQLIAYLTGTAALASTIISTTLNTIFAASTTTSAGIQLLGFVSVGTNVLCTATLVFFLACYIHKVNAKPIEWTSAFCWRFLVLGMIIACIAFAMSAATLIWTTTQLSRLSPNMVGQSTRAVLFGWWGVWGATLLFDVATFGILCHWSATRLHANSVDQLSLDFGIPEPPPMVERPTTKDTTRSFQSQDPTLAATPPRTPNGTSSRNSLKSANSNKVRTSGSRTKLIRQNSFPRDSAKSSLDFALTEAESSDDGFDKWDTSGVGREMRRTLQASPPATRAGLETIPGSRPESPAKTLDGFLPESPHAATTDVKTIADSMHFPSSPISTFPSPPSSPPPNFSRPVSRHYSFSHSTPALAIPPPTPPMEELIHPLFRSNSPSPAPNTTPGTSVHAAPLAGQTISQRTVTRMRSSSLNRQSPSPLAQSDDADQSVPPHSLTRMRSGSLNHSSPPLAQTEEAEEDGPGSPGPSIAEEEELPPILPGFVLSAGQRSSLVGYGKRKSVKGRSGSSGQSHTSSL